MQEFTATYTVVHMAIQAPDSHTLPILLDIADVRNPTIVLNVAKFTRYLQKEGVYSYEKISKAVAALAKFHDYYRQVFESTIQGAQDLKSLVDDFLLAYDHGSVLDWRPATNHAYSQARSAVHEYLKFLMDNPKASWPAAELKFIYDSRISWTSLSHAEKSLLFHTKKRIGKKTRGRKRLIVGLRHFKPFPPHLVVPLIEETKNIRDKILFSLMAYGGRRLSEVLHLLLCDVEATSSRLEVKLRHPAYSPMVWVAPSGKSVKGTRREYLKAVFKLLPRTEHGAKSSAVGWKGMKFDDEATMSSEMYFIREVESYLQHLHRKYLHEIRPNLPRKSHPYYIVSKSGEPMTIKAVEKQFKLACRRIEKKTGVSLAGYGPHSLRHYYGYYCADVLKADLLMIQKWMGHTQPSSTAIYTHITPATAKEVLANSEKRAKLEGRIKVTPEERTKIADAFTSIGIAPLPDTWRLDTTKFGVLDVRKLRRPIKCRTPT